jgi:hypothetical protein
VGFDTIVGPNHNTGKDAHANGIKSSSAIGTSGGETDGIGREVVELCVLTCNEVVVEEEDLVGFGHSIIA